MALLTDGPPSSIEDLTNQDSSLLDVCRVEQINASTKLILALEELELDLAALFERQRSLWTCVRGGPPLDLQHVAVTPTLRLWHTWLTLSLIYRDAYFNQLNDRYQAKWDEYQKLANSARTKLQEIGVGLVIDPLSKPQGPTITSSPATETGGEFYFSITFVNAAGEESGSSDPEAFTAVDGTVAVLQIMTPPANALGWNAYAGGNPDAMYLQNESPLALDEEWIYYPSTAVTTGDTAGTGQSANVIRALPRLLQRG
jgi:hypothetical protein